MANIFFILTSLAFIYPFWMLISISITAESAIKEFGYMLIPKRVDFSAYTLLLKNPTKIIDAYVITMAQALLGTAVSVILMALCAYPLSQKDCRFRGKLSFFIFIPMIFTGGIIPSYILITQYLKLTDTIWAYILPSLLAPFHIMLFRSFFAGLPDALTESAKIDGADEFVVFFRIITPLSKPVFASVFLFGLLARWGDWYTSLVYINDPKLHSLQFLLQRTLQEVEMIKTFAIQGLSVDMSVRDLPSESMRFALCLIAAGPMLIVFPIFQKYFTTGITVGAIKG